MDHFKKKGAAAIRLHYDGLAPSEIATRLMIDEDDARKAVRRYWAYEKRLFGKPDLQDIRTEVFGC